VKEWADVSTGRRRRCGGEYFWELEAVIGIDQWTGLEVHYSADTENSWI